MAGARRAAERALAWRAIDVRDYRVLILDDGPVYLLALHPFVGGEWARGYHVHVARRTHDVTVEPN